MIESPETEAFQDESTPLLASDNSETGTSSPLTASKKWLMLAVCSIFILTLDIGYYLTAAPQTEIFQNIICRKHYPGLEGITHGFDGLDENPCKSEAVQSELALIYGWMDTFTVLPGLLLSIPFGVLADRWGRRPVLMLGLVGCLLGDAWVRIVCLWPNVFPLQLVWLCGLWRVIGGGEPVMTSIVFVMIADICSEEERANVLFRVGAIIIIAEVLATPISAYLMSFNSWFPYMLGSFIQITGALMVLTVPETLELAKEKIRMASGDRQSKDNSEVNPIAGGTTTETVLRRIRDFRDSTHFIWMDINIILILFVSFVATVSRQSTALFLQYTSKKFHWSIARASLLVAVRGTVTLVNFLILMPFLSFILTKYFHLDAKWKDFRLSQGSGLLAIVGFAAIALANTPAVLIFGLVSLSLGSAFAVTSRSLATSLVAPDHVGTLYAAATLIQSLGTIISGPLFAYTFSLGMHFGDAWLGLPFLQAALLFILVFIAVSCIRLESLKRSVVEDGDVQEVGVSVEHGNDS